MTTALITHTACLDHIVPRGHPEMPARLQAVLRALEASAFDALLRNEAPRATRDQLTRVHDPEIVDALLTFRPQPGANGSFAYIDADTVLSTGSVEAALRAAGAGILGVDLVMSGEVQNAFCAVRPPGHHAEPDRPMGFCLFNSVAVAAAHARERYGLARVAVVDFDVHHGNGTQVFFETDAGYLYISSHQSPHYPGTGRADEHGIHGNIMNLPLPRGAGSSQFRSVMAGKALPTLENFAPELVLISAGFDAHAADPLGGLELTEADFAWITHELKSVARRTAEGRIVSTLEGGYDLAALARSAAAHVAALMS